MDSTNSAPLDYFSMIRRRRWTWITPILASALVGWLLVKYLPREYKSSTTIGVTAALVSPSLISQTTPFDNQERMRAIQQQLLSVPILARVARAEGASESQVTRRMSQLRSAISITVPDPVAATNEPRRLDTFVINYTDAEPELAQRIANRLASVFVEENSKVRTERANDTTAFIDAQLAASQVRMTEFEARLRRSKEAHVGQLPEQTQANLQTLAGLRQQTVANATLARGERDRLSVIERQIDAIDRNTVDEPGGNGRPAEGVVSAEARVSTLERDLAAAQATYTDRHPDVLRLKEELVSARRDAQNVRQQPAADRLARLGRNPAYQQLVGEKELSKTRIADLDRDGQETQALIKAYQARVEAAPMVEQQLATIERDYALERQQYSDLSSKQRAATISASVERDRSGERFAVLEPATFPTEPLKPVPMRIMLGSLLAGLCLGAALTLGREYLDTSVHDERDIRDALELPVLGSIKHIPA
jgi:polysaccharide chain length determinant protein (PEP-CTERM system associated)